MTRKLRIFSYPHVAIHGLLLLLALALLPGISCAQNANAGFDPNANGTVRALAVQADGKIIVGGDFTMIAGQNRDHIARLNADGSVDASFAVIAVDDSVGAILVQADGRIVIGGAFSHVGTAQRNHIARLNTNGTLDTSFDPNANGSGVYALAQQADGKLVVGGVFSIVVSDGGGTITRNYLARLNDDGTLDTGFDANVNGSVRALVLQPDGKLVLGGNFTKLSPNGSAAVIRNHIARLNVDGTLDTSYDPNANAIVHALAQQPDGKLVVGGDFTTLAPNAVATVTRNHIARLNTDGTLDTSFDPNANSTVYALAQQPGGTLVVGGNFTSLAPNGSAAVTRNRIAWLHANGTLDTGFDPNANSTVFALAQQADGKLVMGGNFTSLTPNEGATVTRNYIARMNADGSLDIDPYAQSIVVQDTGISSDSTCTLAQAINAANAANGVTAAAVGSTIPVGNCTGAISGPNFISFTGSPTITLTTIDNYWYGANALPPIASTIGIGAFASSSTGATLVAAHVGDPTPATINAFRFFYVSGGMELPAGTLTLFDMTLQGGYAKGGDSTGGGGAGMGGAIFNQGGLTLQNVSLIGNTAQGGNYTDASLPGGVDRFGGGGMGQDGGTFNGGGFGGSFGTPLVGSYGGAGGSLTYSLGGGGGGFIAGSDGGAPAGGGNGGLGGMGYGGGAAGDGGGGGDDGSGSDGLFGGGFGGGGEGGHWNGGGGGVGGGGGRGGGGGGFGGGGGCNGSFGGFGGGGGPCTLGYYDGAGGFGAGHDPTRHSTGGAGMGGAIFNHTGAVSLLNVTASRNAANGGASYDTNYNGSGLGAVLFNLNGSVTIDFSTLAGNSLTHNNGQADSSGPADGAVYSLAYGNKIEDGTASSASLTIHNSIIHGTSGVTNADVTANLVDGNNPNANASSLTYTGKNLVGSSYTIVGVTQTGASPITADPLLGSQSFYRASPIPLPVLPIGSNSPAYNAAPNCFAADGTSTLSFDARGAVRPYDDNCDIGAYEFDGDYIFANGVDVTL